MLEITNQDTSEKFTADALTTWIMPRKKNKSDGLTLYRAAAEIEANGAYDVQGNGKKSFTDMWKSRIKRNL